MGNDNCCGCDMNTHKRDEYISNDLKKQIKPLSPQNNNMDKQTESIETNSPQATPPQPEFIYRSQNEPLLESSNINDNEAVDGKPFSLLELSEFKQTSITDEPTVIVNTNSKHMSIEDEINSNVNEIKTTESESASYSDASTTNSDNDSDSSSDSTMNWKEYKSNLNGLFYLFAAANKNTYMSRNQLKQFLDIIEITNFVMVDDVFQMMDSSQLGKITSDGFIEYFCDPNQNPKVLEIKKYIGKHVSWKLLLKGLYIFDEFDSDDSGMLEYDEFAMWSKDLGLNDKEMEVVWNRVDTNNNGQITIIDLFEWFKKRLEATQ